MPDIHISFRLNPETQRPMTFLNDIPEDAIRSMEAPCVPYRRLVYARLGETTTGNGKGQRNCHDGRDIGTVVFPRCRTEIFVTGLGCHAAQRRYDELQSEGQLL